MKKGHVLVIEDEKIMRVTLVDALLAAEYDALSCETGVEAEELLRDNDFDVIVTDVRLPDINGIDILRNLKARENAQFIVMTGYGTIKDAVEAMKLGAFDYLTKPFSLDEFLLVIEKACEIKDLKTQNLQLRQSLNKAYSLPNIIGESAVMGNVLSMVQRVAITDSTVLVLGESGTGKELIANTIHYQSSRKGKAIIRVNCAALPEGLIESELFGHERGAFTNAFKRKIGKFELAHRGTLFLDEIGDLPMAAQSKILRVLQEKKIERIGGTESISVDVRLIAATNKDLKEEVARGRFREDLFYRLNVVPIFLPPLRERKEDIPRLIEHFIEKNKDRLPMARFTPEAITALLKYDYPGNIRELENIVERCLAFARTNSIEAEDVMPYISVSDMGLSMNLKKLSKVVAEAEREHIIRILTENNGNKTRTAEILGISRKNLWEKMNIYGISS